MTVVTWSRRKRRLGRPPERDSAGKKRIAKISETTRNPKAAFGTRLRRPGGDRERLMKRVLIVGSDFAPSSHPPALRVRFFARHLPEFGWEPIILTTQPEYYETALDPEMNCLVPEWLQVIRTPALSSHFTRMFGVGDLGIRTILHHWKLLNRLCRQRKVDLVFIPVPPYMPMVLGRMIHDKFGIPYVIDYMDPWRTEYYWKVPKARRPPKWVMAYVVARVVEPFAVRRAAHIVEYQGHRISVLAHYPWLRESDASEIPFGGESDD